MSDQPASYDQQALYWGQVVQLKIRTEYIRLYRDDIGQWVRRFAVLRAIASSGAIATWAVVKEYPLVWGGIIAASQVGDALKDAIPLSKQHKAACDFATGLAGLFIEAQFEWDQVASGRFSEEEISSMRKRMMVAIHNMDKAHFPEGGPFKAKLLREAEAESVKYFKATFGVDIEP